MFAALSSSPATLCPPKQRLSRLFAAGPVHCRVAPSPTGHVHLGTVRTALHNLLAARASGGSLLLRIDDTDAVRHQPGSADALRRTLDQLGLHPDRTFSQSDALRKDAYRDAANRLVQTGWAVRDAGAVRLSPAARDHVPSAFFDLASGPCTVSSTLAGHVDGLVLLRSDGTPTYHLASTVDDIDAGITLILRGMDHQPNAAKHLTLARVLACSGHPGAQDFCDRVTLAHVGLILHQGRKLSKRDAASNVDDYLANGVPPGALLQWALSLGWGHPDPHFDRIHPILDLAVMPGVFAQGGLRSSSCSLNPPKLDALARVWRTRGG